MERVKSGFLNPTPISKLFVTFFFIVGLASGNQSNEIFLILTVVFIALFFGFNGRIETAVKTVIFYVVLDLFYFGFELGIPLLIKEYLLLLVILIKLFFLPFLAGKFLIGTSDVSSMIVSMEKMRIPRVIVIPITVVFRYFPAFKEDKRNIKMAMKMRGITFKNPIRYLEYVSVPLLISATNIGDDISKSAETKCISDPCKKTRYAKVRFGPVDVIFVVGIVGFYLLGRVYA